MTHNRRPEILARVCLLRACRRYNKARKADLAIIAIRFVYGPITCALAWGDGLPSLADARGIDYKRLTFEDRL